MLFYQDPFADETFEKIDEISDEEDGDRKRTRIVFDKQEKMVILHQETFCCGHTRNSQVSFSPEVAKQVFPAYAEKIQLLSQ